MCSTPAGCSPFTQDHAGDNAPERKKVLQMSEIADSKAMAVIDSKTVRGSSRREDPHRAQPRARSNNNTQEQVACGRQPNRQAGRGIVNWGRIIIMGPPRDPGTIASRAHPAGEGAKPTLVHQGHQDDPGAGTETGPQPDRGVSIPTQPAPTENRDHGQNIGWECDEGNMGTA